MPDDSKSIADSLLRLLIGRNINERDTESADDSPNVDANTAKALISTLFARAGKGKDEVVQVVAREIGLAVAAMMKEPLALLAKHQKLQISCEFVPKQGHEGVADEAQGKRPHRPRRARASKRAATRRPTPDSETES